MKLWLFSALLASCYPHRDCLTRLGISWSPAACPDPAQDRIAFVIQGDRFEFDCRNGQASIDASKWSGQHVSITVQTLSPSGDVLAMATLSTIIFPSEETVDFNCLDPSFDVPYSAFADGGVDGPPSD